MNIITDIVKEKGITDMIFSYKQQMEWGEILEEHDDDFEEICLHADLTTDFIDYYFEEIEWDHLSTRKLSYKILSRYQENINWGNYIVKNKPSENMLTLFLDNFKGAFEDDDDRDDWFFVSSLYDLSEDFLHRHREKIHWDVFLEKDVPDYIREEYYDIIEHQHMITMSRWDTDEDMDNYMNY